MRHLHLGWLNLDWWKYLLHKPADPGYCSWWTRFWCRASGHPGGVWWHNPGGDSPDMRCRKCYDDIG